MKRGCAFSVTENGTIVYNPNAGAALAVFSWYDRAGEPLRQACAGRSIAHHPERQRRHDEVNTAAGIPIRGERDHDEKFEKAKGSGQMLWSSQGRAAAEGTWHRASGSA
jgi:hypothetical protein